MDIAELQDILAKLPGDLEVIMASDPEGNEFHTLMVISNEFTVLEQDVVTLWPGIRVDPEQLDYVV